MSSLRQNLVRHAGMGLVLLPLGLAGCGPSMSDNHFAPPCPGISILSDAGDLTRYAPGGKDLTEVVMKLRVTGAGGKCEPGPKKDLTKVTVQVDLTALRGPAAGSMGESRPGDVSYFLAVLKDGQILDKSVTRVAFEFPAGSPGVQISPEPQVLLLPTPEGVTAANYRLAVGLQMTPEELARTRAAQGK